MAINPNPINQKAQYKQHNTYHDQSSHKLRINDTITMNGLRQHTAQCPLFCSELTASNPKAIPNKGPKS